MAKPVYAYNKKDERSEDQEIKDVLESDATLAGHLLKQIKTRRESDEFKQYLKDIKLNREYVRGLQHSDEDEDSIVRCNLIHPELKKALNESYAKDPDISISPSEAVTTERYEAWKAYTKTLELVLRKELSPLNADLKGKSKRRIRAADTTGYGWLKVVYQKHIERDPETDQRIHDIQDDIQALDNMQREMEKDDRDPDSDEHKLNKAKLQEQLKTLEAKVEVVRAEGITFSVRQSENVTWSEEVKAPEDMARAPWIDDMIWMTADAASARFGWLPDEATRYKTNKSDGDSEEVTDLGSCENPGSLYVCIHELWNLSDRRVYTMVNGFEGFLRQPYNPSPIGERFHSLFALCFDPTDGTSIPLALVTQLRSLQDEHTTARTNFREHREKSVPYSVAHGGMLDSSDTEKLTNPGFMETIVLRSAPHGQPLETVFKAVQNPPINPAVYDTSHVRADWEQVTRRGDAARGMTAKTKTATEAEILQGNLQVDTSERRDVVEDDIRQVTEYCLQLIIQEMSPQQARRIAGDGAQWFMFEKEQVFDLVQVEIRAGSTGKPDKQLELEKWLKILPILRETLMAIIEMRAANKNMEAGLMLKLARISLERFDERIDLMTLIPEQEDTPEELMERERQAKEAMVAKMLKMKEMISNIANTDADTMNKLADAEAKEVGTQIDSYMAILEGLLTKQQQPVTQPGANNV